MTGFAATDAAPAGEASPTLGVARSARGLRWVESIGGAEANLAQALAQREGLPLLLARLLVARGVDAAAVREHLDPTVRGLMPDPSTLRDMDAAAERLADAIVAGEPIALFGDYDVDGAASVALMQRFLQAHGRSAAIYIPDRLREGYGPSEAAFGQLIDDGARLIVTLDCGASGHGPVAAAARRGVDVIVVDHHLAGETLPPARAVVNPNRLDDVSGQGHLAAAGVAFLVLAATARVLRGRGWYGPGRPAPDLLRWLDLVALATVCDVAALRGLNRAFVVKGLQVLRRRENAGLRALADAAGLAAEPSPYALGFVLGPRINAGGRIGEATLGARLLLEEDEAEAARIAALLERLNAERKRVEALALEEATAQADRALEADPATPFLLAGARGWHKGVVGLVASRLAERFGVPAVAISWDDGGEGAGSARSVAGVDIGSLVRDAVEAGCLVKGGGHPMAAGLTLRRESLDAFGAFARERLARAPGAVRTAELRIDATLSPSACTADLMALIGRAGPFGAGNPQPRFAFAGLRCVHVRPIGGRHLRCALAGSDGRRLDAIAFRAQGTPLGAMLDGSGGARLHVAGHLRLDRWGGRERIELTVEDAAESASGAI